jgi:opacity protein-like surface antigen
MRKLVALTAMAFAVLPAAPVAAADMPDIEIPDVEFDAGDSFYLRGSAAFNIHWAKEVIHPDACVCGPFPTNQLGYGYSWGVGFGYETGTGLRFDATIDTLETRGLAITKEGFGPPIDGDYTLLLRSTLGLANVYYDFSFGDFGFGGGYGGGGTFGYVGAGAGLAWNHAEINAPVGNPIPVGGNVTPAAALMAGIGYDMGSWVMDVGYRGIYLHQINNAPTSDPDYYYEIDNNFIHELRGTVRYRFN